MPDNTVENVEELRRITRDLIEQVEQTNRRMVTCMLVWFSLGFLSCLLTYVLVKVIVAYAVS